MMSTVVDHEQEEWERNRRRSAMVKKCVGSAIRNMRTALGLSRAELAAIAPPFSAEKVSRYEDGRAGHGGWSAEGAKTLIVALSRYNSDQQNECAAAFDELDKVYESLKTWR